jgi:hypothetical protein
MPTDTAATSRANGLGTFRASAIQRQASNRATAAPVMAAVRVPPSACSTSQSSWMVRSPKSKPVSAPRTLRPMSRWISWVRPPGPARSRAVRSWVARGSMAYSAVSQPRPLPRRQGGTDSTTLAVHMTRVAPKRTRHEPSA